MSKGEEGMSQRNGGLSRRRGPEVMEEERESQRRRMHLRMGTL